MPSKPLLDRASLLELVSLATPMVISQGSHALMIFTDRYFMAQLDATHIAAALGGGLASFFSVSLFAGIIAYTTAMVAQYYGAGQLHRCSQVLTQALLLSLAAQPILLLVTLFVGDLFAAMNHVPEQVVLERSYYFVLMAGSFLLLAKVALASFFAGIGSTRVIMFCDVLAVLCNVPLSYVLIFGKFGLPALGLAGAGIGTLLALAIGVACYLAFYLRAEMRKRFSLRASLRADAPLMINFLRLGFPAGFEHFATIACFNLFLLMFQSYGVMQGASIAIVFNWDILSFVPMVGMSIAVTSVIGRLIGAGRIEDLDRMIRAAFVLSLGYTGVLAACFIIWRIELVNVFATGDAEFEAIRTLAGAMMIGMASYVMADAISLVTSGVLRGAGDTRWVMVSSILLHLLMLAGQYLVIMVLQAGPLTSWWAFVALLYALALTYVWRLRSGVWRQPQRLARVLSGDAGH